MKVVNNFKQVNQDKIPPAHLKDVIMKKINLINKRSEFPLLPLHKKHKK